MKVGLCLGGGGARGYAHIGAIRALIEAGIKIDLVNGTSIGAIMGGMYALCQDIDRMTALVKETVDSVHVNHFDLFHQSTEGPVFLQHWLTDAVCNLAVISKSIQSNRNNQRALQVLFGDSRFADTRIPFSAVAMDIMTGKTVVMKRGKLAEAALASSAIPGIFPPVARGKKLLVDGSVLANIPIPELRREGADFIISVELVEKLNPDYKNGVDIIYLIEAVKQKQMEKWALEETDFHIKIDTSDFAGNHFENYLEAIELGYSTARAVIPKLHKKLGKSHV
jgi:NTE family protein